MSSTFFGLEIGRSSLQAQQKALEVTGHNIANANTVGYTRQDAVLVANPAFTVPGYNRPTTPGQVGTGVSVDQIRRIRDQFLDIQVRTESKNLGYWQARTDTMNKIQVIVNEPSDNGLRSVLDNFWAGWEELSKNPESLSVRAVVRQRGIAVADTINHMDRLYKELQSDINDSIKVKVNDINTLAKQISGINTQILSIEANGDKANDLRDKRDILLDQLSKIVDIKTTENSHGVVTVTVGGRVLVMNGNTATLSALPDADHDGFVNVVWTEDKRAVNFSSGELQGLLESRGYVNPNTGQWEGIVPDMRKDLDLIAKTIIEETNATHNVGYDLDGNIGGNFFEPIENIGFGISIASGIKIAANIEGNLNKIAAASDTVRGNGDNALELAELKHKLLINLSNSEAIKDIVMSRDNNVLDQLGNEVTFTPATAVVGGAFGIGDLNNDAALVITQGENELRFVLKSTAGVPYAGDFNQMVQDINSQAEAAGLKIFASLVEEETFPGTYRVQISSTEYGGDWVVNVAEDNFVGAATFGFEDYQASAMKMGETAVLRADGITKINISGATEAAALANTVMAAVDGPGVLFLENDFLANAELVIRQGTNSFSVPLTNGAGTAAGVFGATVGDLINYINNQADLNGMDLYAQLVPSASDPTRFQLQIKATGLGNDQEVRVLEKNFKDTATFGFINPASTGTVDDFYRAQTGKLGVSAQEAQRMTDNQQLLVDQLDNQKASISGVSLDEEMANMIKFQHAYNAAARVVTVMDEMLDKIINGTGLTR